MNAARATLLCLRVGLLLHEGRGSISIGLRPAFGGGVRFGEDESGRRVLLEREAIVAAPAFPAEIEAALLLLGSGSTKQGLRYLSQHPAMKGWDNFTGDSASKSADRIEGQWIRCYLRAMRNGLRAQVYSNPPPLRRTQ